MSKLFGVLVVGGSLVSGCGEEQQPAAEGADAGESFAGRTSEIAREPIDRASGDTTDGELIDCGFCPNEMCCEVDEEGNSSVKVGFECCWGTAC